MEVAIAGLVGALIGALITASVTYWIARRDDELKKRAAIRLFCMDLYKAQALMKPIRHDGKWGIDKQKIPISAYKEHSFNLARMLDADRWKRVEGTVLGIQRLREIQELCEAENKRPPTNVELEDFDRIGKFVDETLEQLDAEGWAINKTDGFDGYAPQP